MLAGENAPAAEPGEKTVEATFRVSMLRRDAGDAMAYGCTGLLGIHWRTRVLGPNVAALARVGGFLGAFSLLGEMPEVQGYLAALEHVHERMPEAPSIVHSSVVTMSNKHSLSK